MTETNIYILCPDFSFPVGGVKILYRHVDILNNHGLSAFILHRKTGFRCTWFENNTRVTCLAYLAQTPIQQSDYLVFPEECGFEVTQIKKGIKKVIFNQNCYYTFKDYFLEKENFLTPYLDRDTIATIVVSEDSKSYLSYVFPKLKVLRIHNAINPDLFFYQSHKKKQICFMPRKNFPDALQVFNILKFRNALGDFAIVQIQDKSEKEVAEILRESLIFLSFGYPEGFSMPPAEAMACGCLVIGYHGMGGKEYFKPDFSFPIEVGDIIGFAKTVEQVIQSYEENPDTLIKKAKIAADFIKENHSPEIEIRDVVQCWNSILGKATSSISHNFNLREINLIIFPEWGQPEESLSLELERVIRAILTHPEKNSISLLIDTSNIPDNSEVDANLVLSGVVMNLLMQEDLDVTTEPEISLVGKVSEIEWQALLPQIQYWIRLENENQQVSAKLELTNIQACKLDQLIAQQSLQLYLCNQLYRQGRYEEAIEKYQKFLEIQTGDAELYFNLSECFRYLHRIEEAIHTLQEGIRCYQTNAKLHFYLIQRLQESGKIQEAISAAETASNILQNEYVFKILNNLIVPIVYNTAEEISFHRQRFVQGLENLIQQTSLETPKEKTNALRGISCVTNFYLVYQAHNDRDLQRQYGNLLHQITAANYPKWVEPLSLPPLQENQKIRVGYISAYLHAYSGTYWLLGWLRHCNRQNFEIYCYYTGNDPDIITQQFQQYSDVFHHIPGNLEAVSQQILDDRLHILVFPEIGMDAPTIPIASLRLAPVQCTAWGHPVTSGLPTIDYYLSSELMEPENAQEHYTETLIRLPNLAIAYPKPDIPALTKTRSDFALRDDAVVYLCCQAPFKYLPQHDFIFTEIARHVPQAQFVFIRADNLKPRLLKAFAAAGLKCEDYCVFLPFQARFDYLMLNLLCDVYLDSFGFSGGNTTLDAIACNLPIVTCPGEFMRGRLSYAMLTRLGLSETIAQDEAEYIDIAVRLGLEPVWRDRIVQYTAEHHDCLYNDTTCVAVLEEFYQRVVQEGLTQR